MSTSLFYYSVYKPFQVMCQFSPGEGKKTLKDVFSVPASVYPVGRLDYDSEGLLLLTNDKSINHRLLQPRWEHEREYWVQVEGDIQERDIEALQHGVDISIKGKKYRTKRCIAHKFIIPPEVPERNPPIRYRKLIPTSWISLVLSEGKNRQVRKMTAAVGFPTLRLFRYRIGKLTLEDMQPGNITEWGSEDFKKRLFS